MFCSKIRTHGPKLCNVVWVWSPLRTPRSSNKSTYLNVYFMKHRWLLTMNIRIHILLIVYHPSYMCIVLWRVRFLFFKAVANFCRKGCDLGQVNILTLWNLLWFSFTNYLPFNKYIFKLYPKRWDKS